MSVLGPFRDAVTAHSLLQMLKGDSTQGSINKFTENMKLFIIFSTDQKEAWYTYEKLVKKKIITFDICLPGAEVNNSG